MSTGTVNRRSSSAAARRTPAATSTKAAASTSKPASTPTASPKPQPAAAATKMVQTQANAYKAPETGANAATTRNRQLERATPSSRSGAAKPALTGSGSTGAPAKAMDPQKQQKLADLASSQGKTGRDAVRDPNNFQTKPLITKMEQERTQGQNMVSVGGQTMDVRDKAKVQLEGSTAYFTDQQKADSKVSFSSTTDASGVSSLKLQNAKGPGSDAEKHLFVMDKERRFYSHDANKAELGTAQIKGAKTPVHVHHSSFLKGAAVGGAGELRTRKEDTPDSKGNTPDSKGNTLHTITDRSGHHHPGGKQTLQTLNQLDRIGQRAGVTGAHEHTAKARAGIHEPGKHSEKFATDGTSKIIDVKGKIQQIEMKEAQQTSKAPEPAQKSVLDNVKFEMNRGGASGGDKETRGMATEFIKGQGSESLFTARHAVADEIKARGAAHKTSLDSVADKRALDVEKATEKPDLIQTGGPVPASWTKDVLIKSAVEGYGEIWVS